MEKNPAWNAFKRLFCILSQNMLKNSPCNDFLSPEKWKMWYGPVVTFCWCIQVSFFFQNCFHYCSLRPGETAPIDIDCPHRYCTPSLSDLTFSKWLIYTIHVVITRNHALLVLLCDAVARGLYQHLAVPDNMEQAYPQEKGKVKSEKAIVSQAAVLDPEALLKVQKAFEVCQCV